MPTDRLSKEQSAARNALAALLADAAEADHHYDSLTGTRGGRIISTDLARFLDERYRDTPAGQPRDLLPGWDLAWRYAHHRLRRELQNRGKREVVGFMAGGWGSGKTHALEHAPIPDLSWDGTLSDPKWATEMIGLALSHGWQVDVTYVFRDIELAIYGAVERFAKEGRSVPLGELPRNHRSVQRSILKLVEEYRWRDQVSFLLIHNTGTETVPGKALIFEDAELAPGGALHYSPSHESYYAEVARKIRSLNDA